MELEEVNVFLSHRFTKVFETAEAPNDFNEKIALTHYIVINKTKLDLFLLLHRKNVIIYQLNKSKNTVCLKFVQKR